MTPAAGLPETLLVVGAPDARTPAVTAVLDGAATQTLVVGIRPGATSGDPVLGPSGVAAQTRYGVDLLDAARRLRLTGAAGESAAVVLPELLREAASPPWSGLPDRVVLVGLGDAGERDLRRAGAAVGRQTDGLDQAVVAVDTLGAGGTRALVEGFLLVAHRPPRTGRTPGPRAPLSRLVLLGEHHPDAVAAARRTAEAAWTARTLAATPSNVKNPAWFAEQARAAAAGRPDLRVTVHDETWLAAHGFGGVLAVGAGSIHPPRLVVVEHVPGAGAGTAGRHVVLVGKGVTFDTGGLSVKGAQAMVPMKTDMTGAAAALAAVVGAARAGVPHRVTAVLPMAENALSGSAYRPGDVVTTASGTTVEILNTDAEGRLLLADALAWAVARLRPDVVVDVATLTGAATLGLGRGHGALYATDEALARSLLAAGAAAGEPAWRMPLVEEYGDALSSPVADVANVARDRVVGAGSVLAALFLRRFVGRTAWAHLDIAGPARSAKAEHEVPEGATGFGARLLLRWLEDLEDLEDLGDLRDGP